MTKTEKLGEQIREAYELLARQAAYGNMHPEVFKDKLRDSILSLSKEAELAFVDEKAELPNNPRNSSAQWERWYDYMCGQQSLREAGYRKVEPIEVKDG